MEKKQIFWIVFGFTLFSLIMYSGLFWCIFEDKKDAKIANEKFLKEQSTSTTCSYKRDSLQQEVNKLSIYKSLTKSMVFRDEAVKLLPHKIGDIIFTKNDSIKGVIEDVIIGGSKFNFYIKYKILLKDNSTREITPELIY